MSGCYIFCVSKVVTPCYSFLGLGLFGVLRFLQVNIVVAVVYPCDWYVIPGDSHLGLICLGYSSLRLGKEVFL